MFVRGCEKFLPALAYLFCLALPGSCLARFTIYILFLGALYVSGPCFTARRAREADALLSHGSLSFIKTHVHD